MLIEFAVTNYRSIKNRQSISFQADGNTGLKTNPDNLIFMKDKSHGKPLINAGIVYGANASGKSNFLKAIHALETMVKDSYNEFRLDQGIPSYEPFKLDGESKTQPTTFEIDFIAKDNLRYKYLVSFNQTRILHEELNFYEKERKVNRSIRLFLRIYGNQTEFGGDYKGKRELNPLENQLLLSLAGREDLPSLRASYRFFSTYLFTTVTQSSLIDQLHLKRVERILLGDLPTSYQRSLVSLIIAADTGITNISVKEGKFEFSENMPEDERNRIIKHYKYRIKTSHPIFINGIEAGEEPFDLLNEESTGTIKFLGIASIVIDALDDGSTIIIDELDKHLHPLLTRMIINLFYNPETNPNHAQLIFSTHDVSLFDRNLFRRDQIFLVDKTREGISQIGRLSDFKGVSKVVPLEKWYMAGLFRAVPSTNPYAITFVPSIKSGV